MSTILSVSGLCKSYPGFQLDKVSFQLEQGRIMGFIGRNGAGKTTTLKSLLNFIHPDSGSITFFGKSLEGHELEIKQELGYVSGGVDYYPRAKLKNITKVASRLYDRWDKEEYAKYMQLFSLEDSKSPSQLSAGMKVKYSLALALSHHARLLILDEPTSGLDPVSREDLLEIFLNLQDRGVSILFSTHITSDLEKCADDITYIKKGQIVQSCPLDQFREGYRLLTLPEDSIPPEIEPHIIGIRRSKGFRTAMVPRDASSEPESRQPSLEEIMSHMEVDEL